jgi:hypothetical protein
MAKYAKCKGADCEFFRKYYGTQKYGTAYIPDFKTVDLRCAHPSIWADKGWGHRDGAAGVQIMMMRICPVTNETEEM